MAKKELKMSKNSVNVVIGINISLLSVLLLISNWTGWLSFLAKGVSYILGFIGFWVLVPYLFILGLYIALRRRLVHFKVGTSLVGVFLIIFAAGLLTSHFSTKPISIDMEGYETIKAAGECLSWKNSITTFKAVFAKSFDTKDAASYIIATKNSNGLTASVAISGGVTSAYLGGGFFCYIFLGLFNSISGDKPILMIVVSVILVVIGLCLLLNQLIRKGFGSLKNRKNGKKKESESESVEPEREVSYITSPSAEVSSAPAPQPDYAKYQIKDEDKEIADARAKQPTQDDILARTMESYNAQHPMQRAMFDFGNDTETEDSHIINENETDDSGISYANNEPVNSQYGEAQAYAQNQDLGYSQPAPQPSYESPKSEPVRAAVQGNLFDENFADESGDSFVSPETNYNETPVQPEAKPAYVQPQPAVVPTPAPVTSAPALQPAVEEQPKKRVLHWDEDDEIVVDIPKYVKRPPYVFPPLSLLEPHEKPEDAIANEQSSRDTQTYLTAIFNEMKIGATIPSYKIGPSITSFDVKMNEGRSLKEVERYVDDISVRLGGVNIIFKPMVLGKANSTLEVPNTIRTTVGLLESIRNYPAPTGENVDTNVPFGKDIDGNVVSLKVADFPHMLVAGTTGSGKSVFMHNLIVTLIMRNRPEDLKLVLIDPKGVEMSCYKKIPHLICPMIVDPQKANVALGKLCDEMEHRNKIFASAGVRELKEFNKIAESRGWAKIPTIVVFVDEFADLSEQCKGIDEKIQRIGQKARTAGIHLVIATQRPSADVINGTIKANLPTKVALSVNNVTNSLIIIDEKGAEKLLGNGDMLIDSGKLSRSQKVRVQSCFASTMEINNVCDFLRSHYEPMYWDEFHDLTDHSNDVSTPDTMSTATQLEKSATDNELYEHIKSEIMMREYCSISYIQRSYAVGFPKAGKIFARLQQEGIVDKQVESASRGCKVLVKTLSTDQNAGSIEQSELVRDFDPNSEN